MMLVLRRDRDRDREEQDRDRYGRSGQVRSKSIQKSLHPPTVDGQGREAKDGMPRPIH